jgi:uncharacterized protein YecE (DUF72 family)
MEAASSNKPGADGFSSAAGSPRLRSTPPDRETQIDRRPAASRMVISHVPKTMRKSRTLPPRIWIGTSGYQYPEWRGKFYPEQLSTAKMLAYYAERFPTTEVNYSFRRIPSEKALKDWTARTPEHFRFSLKAPQKITHFAKLRDCEETTRMFMQRVKVLGAKLGPILFQLPPTLKADTDLLKDFLAGLPKGTRAAFEFRHPSWFEKATFAALKKHGAALCIADTDDLASPFEVTADFLYLRLRRVDYKPRALERWAAQLRENAGDRETFVYFKHEETGVGPKFAQIFVKKLRGLAAPGI